jgi:hypothetical protein
MSDPGRRAMRERAAQYRREAWRIRGHAATATTPAVRQQLVDKARQLEELAGGLEKAALQGEVEPP